MSRRTRQADMVAVQKRRVTVSPRTRRTHELAAARYKEWCETNGLDWRVSGHKCLAAWLMSRFYSVAPATMRYDVSGVKHLYVEVGLDDPTKHPLVRELVRAHGRFHGRAPKTASTSRCLSPAEVVSLATCPVGLRGNTSNATVGRLRCAIWLAHQGIELDEMLSVEPRDIIVGSGHVTVVIPSAASAEPAKRAITLKPVGKLDPVSDFASLCEETANLRTLLGFTQQSPTSPIREVSTGKARDMLTRQLARATRNAGLGRRVVDFAAVQGLGDADVERLWHYVNPCYLRELLVRTYVVTAFATAARHSDLAAVDPSSLTFTDTVVTMTRTKSKNDVYKKGRTLSVHHFPGHPEFCPGCALVRWAQEADIMNQTHLFPAGSMNGGFKPKPVGVQSMNGELKRLAANVGVETSRVGTHSLRKAHVTARVNNGEEIWSIAQEIGITPGVAFRNYVAPNSVDTGAAQL